MEHDAHHSLYRSAWFFYAYTGNSDHAAFVQLLVAHPRIGMERFRAGITTWTIPKRS
jgi:hypothetical protein